MQPQPFSEILKELSEDELCLLYGIINCVPPKTLTAEIPISLFGTFKRDRLKKKLMSANIHVKPEFLEVYKGLLSKIK